MGESFFLIDTSIDRRSNHHFYQGDLQAVAHSIPPKAARLTG
jgi:hypothetical protein